MFTMTNQHLFCQLPEAEQAWYLVSIGKTSDWLRLRNGGKPMLRIRFW